MGRLLFDDADKWAVDRPNATAIAWTDQDGQRIDVTYLELSRRSAQVANQLSMIGVGAGSRVAICMAKGPDAIVAMLGVLKAGGAYVPLDPESPSTRIGLILDAARPDAVIAEPGATNTVEAIAAADRPVPTGTLAATRPDWGIEAAFTGTDLDRLDDTTAPDPGTTDTDLAHILFTSGSTGTPKGVMITHANVTACVDWGVEHFGYGADDRISGHSPLHFDLSTFDIYTAFAAGCTLFPVPARVNINPADLAGWIRESALTQWFSVPSALNLLVRFEVIEPGDFPELRRLIWCGEVLPTPTLIALMERLPHPEFTNLYGPTEATIASSWYRVPACPDDPTESIPIGRPCEGEQLAVFTEAGVEAADGETGDLYIEGVGLSPGYWNDDEKTTAAFRTDLVPGRRLYRTGDLGFRRPDGEFGYVGRTDSQIKSRGHRIELGEIETALATVDGIDDVAIVAIDTGSFEGAAICAAYVSAVETRPAVLAKQLATLVPNYMLPHRWMGFESLPKNLNGKIDRPELRNRFEDQKKGAS